jgi:hypothetical protein
MYLGTSAFISAFPLKMAHSVSIAYAAADFKRG